MNKHAWKGLHYLLKICKILKKRKEKRDGRKIEKLVDEWRGDVNG